LRKHTWPVIAAALLAALSRGATSYAEPAQPQGEAIAELKQQVQELQRKIEALEALDQKVTVIDHKLQADEKTQHDNALTMPVIQASKDGFFIKSPDQSYQLHIGGWTQAEGRFYMSQEPAGVSSTFVMRRIRPYLEGTVGKYYDFRILTDFGQGATTVQDAYTDIHYFDHYQLEAGKFKEPVGLERLQDDRYLELPERSLVTDLVPDRSIGAALHGDFFDKTVEYKFSVMNVVPDNTASVDTSTNSPKDFAGRLFLHPFRTLGAEPFQGFGVGLGASFGDDRGSTVLDSFKSTFQNTFFTYKTGVFAAGERYRISPQFNYYYGPFVLFGEYVENWQQVGRTAFLPKKKGKKHAHEYEIAQGIDDQAWNLTAGYVLTGDATAYDGVRPRYDFDPLAGRWGAIELVARIDQLLVDRNAFTLGFADPTVSAREDLEFAAGLDWYLNRNVKLQTVYARNSFTLGAAHNHNRPAEEGILTMLQLQF